MAFKFRDLMIDVLPKQDAAQPQAFCPFPSAQPNQPLQAVYCNAPSTFCPIPSAARETPLLLCPFPSAIHVQPVCADPSAVQAQALCPAPSGALNACPSPTAVAQAAQPAQAAADFDETSAAAMAALREQLQKALAQVEEQEEALRQGAAGSAGEPVKE